MANHQFVPTQMASVVKKGAAEVHLDVVGNEFSTLFKSIKSGVQTGVKTAVKAGTEHNLLSNYIITKLSINSCQNHNSFFNFHSHCPYLLTY